MVAKHRGNPARLALALFAALFVGAAGAMAAEMVKPLPGKDCKRARVALENGLLFGPGFRRLGVEFQKKTRHRRPRLPAVDHGHRRPYGRLRHPLTQGHALQGHAGLEGAGMEKTAETALFSEKSKHGRETFALYKDNALCVTTIVVGLVNGATPAAAAIKDGKVMLSKVMPYQREWWVSVDCFTMPNKAQVEAQADIGADVGADVGGNFEGEVSLEAIKELEAEAAK
jgi:hypothetical protein